MNSPDPETAPLLAASVFAVSLLNAAVGPTGGVNFAVMASVLPPQALIPLHGTVEAFSALYRAVLLRTGIDWTWTGRFAAGSALGLPFGLWVAGTLPSGLMLTAIGLFILGSVWWPVSRAVAQGTGGSVPAAITGALTTGLTMVFGATSPLVAGAMARRFPDPRALIGTHAAAMTIQHGLKLPAFASTGFDFLPWLWLLTALCLSVTAGTWAGKHLLGRWPEARFRAVFRLLMTALAIRLVAKGTGIL